MIDSKLYSAREKFRKGFPLEDGEVRPDILESWRRSKKHGLSFEREDPEILTPAQLRQRIDGRRLMFDVAVPFIKSLYEFTAGFGILSLLADEDGYILYIIGDADIAGMAKENHIIEGSNSSERCRGTNSAGTVLMTGKPMQIIAEEHYHTLYQNWVCSGAPIFDSDDNPAGVFCLMGTPDKVSYHTLGMAVASAEAITRQIKMKRTFDEMDQIKQQLEVMVETVPSGVILLNDQKAITQFNGKAAKLLMQTPAALRDKNIADVFGKDVIGKGVCDIDIDELPVTIGHHGTRVSFSVNIQCRTKNYLITFDKYEVLRKKVNRIAGSEARFTFADIVGNSDLIDNTISLARIASGNASNVLLTGESGTGKELFAQAIHNASPRREGPFVAINCGALPRSLIESELFGYEGGTFTGAHKKGNPGKFELANRGTIFLDEIGEMPLESQVALLRVLQNKVVTRLGATAPTSIDVRVIAATNKDLWSAVLGNAFRSDLLYRLNVFSIHIPPLRERKTDIRVLAEFFLAKYAGNANQVIEGFTGQAMAYLEQLVWNGNVRELENVIERAVYTTRENWIRFEDLRKLDLEMSQLPDPVVSLPARKPPAKSAVYQQVNPVEEQKSIEDALSLTRGNIKRAAEFLGMNRRTLYRKFEKYQIAYDKLRGGDDEKLSAEACVGK